MTANEGHDRVEAQFSAYLEGDLDPRARGQVEEHLATCLQCRTHLAQFRQTVGGLATLKRKAPPTFLPDIQKQIHRRSRGRFFGRRWLLFGRIPFEWVSLVMIIAMLLLYIYTLQSQPGSVSPGP